jgi:hypothetical protein
MSITIKAIDILKTENKYQVREIHDGGGTKGQVYNTHDTLYSEAVAITSAIRRAVLLKIKYLGITEVA